MKRFRATALVAAGSAIVAFVLLLPARGIDSDPPECYAYLGYVVPCGLGPQQPQGAGFAGAGAAAAALFAVAGSAAGRRELHRT